MKKQPMIILDEHPNWLQPLYSALGQKGVEYQKLDISNAAYDPAETNLHPFYVNRLSPSAGKRGHEQAFSYAFNYISFLEGNGARVVNGSKTVLLEISKAFQSQLLHRLHIPQPRTLIANNPQQFLRYLDQITFPVVVKPNIGGSGAGIQKFFSERKLREAIAAKTLGFSLDKLVLLQEFIQPKDGYIVRVETIGGKVAYAMKVYTGDTFNLCPSDSCDIERIHQLEPQEMGYCAATPTQDVRFELYADIPMEIKHTIERLMVTAGLEIGGVEYVVNDKNQWFVYDINALSILRSSFKQEYGIDGWGMLADYLIAEYSKVVS